MKDLLLSLVLLAAAIYGYFLMGKADEFMKEIRRAKHEPSRRRQSLKKRKK